MVDMTAQTRKRAGSPLTKEGKGAEASSKKQERSSETLPDTAVPLRLSAVYFTGEAKCFYGDGTDEEYLEEFNASEKGLWQPTLPPYTDLPVQPSSWSETDSAFVYRLVNQFSFIYKRSTYIGGNSGDAWSVILHDEPDDQSPLLFLHPAELNHPFDRIGEGTPQEGIIPAHASRYTRLTIAEPDIQFADEEDGYESDEVERCWSHPEHVMSFGWTGNWTRKLLTADKKNHKCPNVSGTDPSLGFLDRVVWSGKWRIGGDDPPLWGMHVKLVPVPGSTTQSDFWCEDCIPEKERLESYKIRATVSEVYVKRSFFDEREVLTE